MDDNEIIARATDSYSLFLALEQAGKVDETNFRFMAGVLRLINRYDLLQFLTLRRKK